MHKQQKHCLLWFARPWVNVHGSAAIVVWRSCCIWLFNCHTVSSQCIPLYRMQTSVMHKKTQVLKVARSHLLASLLTTSYCLRHGCFFSPSVFFVQSTVLNFVPDDKNTMSNSANFREAMDSYGSLLLDIAKRLFAFAPRTFCHVACFG